MSSSWLELATVVALLLLLVVLAQRLKSRRAAPAAPNLPYVLVPSLLTDAERSFFLTLQQAVGDEFVLFAKVRLADLLVIPPRTAERQAHFNRISAKHVDIVCCEPRSFAPRLAVELDDSSHNRADRQVRDVFVDDALQAAKLPILRMAARRTYSVRELQDLVHATAGGVARGAVLPVDG